jgi:hypothetical protein
MQTPQNRRFYGKMEWPSFWPSYIGVKGRGLWAKHMGLKRGAIGNTLEEHIRNLGNILGTWWESIGNLKGTFGNKGEKKKSFPPLPPAPKTKIKALWVHDEAFPLASWNFLFLVQTAKPTSSEHWYWSCSAIFEVSKFWIAQCPKF